MRLAAAVRREVRVHRTLGSWSGPLLGYPSRPKLEKSMGKQQREREKGCLSGQWSRSSHL